MSAAESPKSLVSLEALGFGYPGAPAPVFTGLDAALPAGVTLVCGDEGAGKSTLLRLLAGDLVPQAGRVLLDGAPCRPQDVAWFDPLNPSLDQREVQQLLAELVPGGSDELPALVDRLSLAPHLPKPLYQLSTGSRRKVFIAAALARRARLTLLDQPFMALDRPSVDFLIGRFARFSASGEQALLIADYLAPDGLPLAATLDLDQLR